MPNDDAELWERYAATRSIATRNALVEFYLPLVRVIARTLFRRIPRQATVGFDDLVSEGAIGLMQAIEKFDQSRGLQFGSFAGRRIAGAMLDFLRRIDPVPRSERRRLAEAGEAVPYQRPLPLNIESNDDTTDLAEWWEWMLRGLLPRDRAVLELYYREGLLMQEVGEQLGLTQSRVSQLHADALRLLKTRPVPLAV